jgi:hypothetical protein
MGEDKIIRAFPSRDLPECPVKVEEKAGYCRHGEIALVAHERRIECAECGATLDPFDYLLGDARAIRRGWENYRHVQQLIKERMETIAKLDKEKRRLQAQVRRINLRKPT